MRIAYSLFFVLEACASHTVRCDGRLQPINSPAPAALVAPGSSTERVAPPIAHDTTGVPQDAP